MSDNLLPNDVWQLIVSRLGFTDVIRFRAVSKSWNSLLPARLPPLLMLSAQVEDEEEVEDIECLPPWLMHIQGEDDPLQVAPRYRGFVTLGQQYVHKISFPEAYRARVVGSTGNWLLIVHLHKAITILNPFSKHEISLPPLTTFKYAEDILTGLMPDDVYRDGCIWKIVLSSSSPDTTKDCVAVTIYNSGNILAMARPGDHSWTTFQTPYSPSYRDLRIEDVLFYNNRFYAVDIYGKLIACDTGDCPKLWYLNDGIQVNHLDEPQFYLVEWVGELLLVIRIVDNPDSPDYKTKEFQLYKLDSETQEWNDLKSLGEYSLFLGLNTSVSLLASDYYNYFEAVKRNCIYFTDDYTYGYMGSQIPGGRDMGVFDLDDHSVTPHFRGVSTSHYSPPVWIIPS